MPRTKPHPSPATLGQRLRAARAAAGLTQGELAAAMEIPSGKQTVSEVERGLWVPTLDWTYRAAVAMGVDPSTLDDRLAAVRAQ
jgi:transcriptional regulator with XRE-family HTH domain